MQGIENRKDYSQSRVQVDIALREKPTSARSLLSGACQRVIVWHRVINGARDCNY